MQDDKSDPFDSTGESRGWISIDQASTRSANELMRDGCLMASFNGCGAATNGI